MTEPTPKITLVPSRHRRTLLALRRDRWVGAAEGGPPGNSQDALVRLGVAEVRHLKKPYARQVARLSALGEIYVAAHGDAIRDAAAQADASLVAQMRRSDSHGRIVR